MFEQLRKEKGIFYFEGALFIILGILAIVLPQIMTVSLGIMAGVFLVLAGIVMFFRGLRLKTRGIFWSSTLAGIVSLIIGVLILMNLTAGIYALTLLLIAFLCFEGIFKIILANILKPAANWGYMLFSGITALVLAFLIVIGLPATAFWALGLIFGVYLLVAGFSMIAFGIGLGKTTHAESY